MRTLNVRLAIMLLIVGVVLGGGVHLLHYTQVRRQATSLLAAADRAREETKYRVAIDYLNSYLALVPQDIETRQKLGFWLAETGQFGAAYGVLEEVLRAKEEAQEEQYRSETRRKLVDIALAIRRWPDAEVHLRYLLQETPEDAELLDLLGQCQVALGRDRAAVDTFRHALRLAPGQVDSYPRLAWVLRNRLEQAKNADKVMEQMVKLNPRSAKANLHLGHYFYGLAQFDDAIKQAKRVLELKAEDPGALWLGGRCSLEKQQYDAATEYATRGIKASKGDKAMYILLADIKLRTGRRLEAIAALKQGLQMTKGTPGYGEILWHMANLHIDSGDPAEATKIINELRQFNYPRPHLRCLEGRVELAMEHWTNARTIFESIRPDLTDSPALLKHVDFWIGKCYGQSGNIEQQLAAYRRAVAVDPFFFAARSGIADILINSGQLNSAIDEYRQAMKAGHRNELTMLALARTLVLRNLRVNPADRDWNEVEQVLKQAAILSPSSSQVPLLHAEALVAQDRMEEAERLLTELRQSAPDRIEFWTSLVALAGRQEKWEQAEKLLEEAKQKLGDRVPLRLSRAQYLFKRFGRDAGSEFRKLAGDVQAFSAEDQVRLYNGLVGFCIQANDLETAKRLCQFVSEKEPQNVRIRYLLFELALRSRESRNIDSLLAELGKVLSEIEAIAGRGPLWLYGQAVRLTVQSKENNAEMLGQALECLARAREMRPTWSRLPLLAGGIYETQGKLDQAMDNYLQAISLGERDPEIIRRTVQLLFQNQRYSEADRLLRRLEDRQIPFTSDMNRMWTEIALRQGNFEQALEMAQKSINEGSKDYRDHLWHGQVMGILARRAKADGRIQVAAKTLEKAEKALRRALELRERSADCWVSLVQLLAAMDQRPKARETIVAAQAKIPQQQAPLALAHCYEAVGELNQARAKFEAALAAAPDNAFIMRQVADFYLRTDNNAAADPLLRRLIASKGKASELDILWSRRMLAIILFERTGFPNLTEAQRLIGENLASPLASIEDRRVKARLLLADPRRVKSQEAVQLLESLNQSGEQPTADDRFSLAQLYLAQGDWTKYLTQMRSVLGTGNPSTHHIAAYVHALVQHHELSEADLWLSRIEQAAPNQFGTVSLRAEIMLHRNQQSQMFDMLMSYLDKPNAQPASRADRMALTANFLEQSAAHLAAPREKAVAAQCIQKAETLFRSLMEQQPGRELTLATFLARQNRIQEALIVVERYWATSSPEALASTALTIVRGGAVAEQIAQLDTILKAALQKFNQPVSLLIAAADSSAMQGRYEQAERFYREVIAKDSGNAVAMNNLGVIMALRGIRLDESLKLVDRAMELAGPVAAMLDSRATVYLAMEQPDKALADLELAVADEATPVRLFHQARAYSMAGKKAEAVFAMEAAQKKNLKRTMLDLPERPIYDKLRDDLQM